MDIQTHKYRKQTGGCHGGAVQRGQRGEGDRKGQNSSCKIKRLQG